MTVDNLKNILIFIGSEWINEFAQEIIQSMNEPWERAARLLNVGDPVIVGGYIGKVEVLTDVVRYHLENGAVIEMEKKK